MIDTVVPPAEGIEVTREGELIIVRVQVEGRMVRFSIDPTVALIVGDTLYKLGVKENDRQDPSD